MTLPKFEDWKAPWETKGEDFDEEKAKRYIYDLSSDKEKLQGRVTAAQKERDEARTAVTEKQKELDAAVAKGPDAEAVTRLQNELAEAKSTATKAEQKALRYEVAADKGVPLAQAKRLQGSTKEELEADADEFLESFGSAASSTGEEDEDGVPSRTPTRLRTPGDPGDGDDDGPIDIDKAIDSIPRL